MASLLPLLSHLPPSYSPSHSSLLFLDVMLLPQGLCSSPNTPSYPPDPCLHVSLVERPSVNTRYKIIIPTHPPYPLYQTLFFSKAFHHPLSDDVFLICLPQYRTLSFIRTSTLFSCGIPRTQKND